MHGWIGSPNSDPKLNIKSLPAPEDGEVISYSEIPEGSYNLQEIHFSYKSENNSGGNMKHVVKTPSDPLEGDEIKVEKLGTFGNILVHVPMAIHSREKDVVLDDLRSYYGNFNDHTEWEWKLYERGVTYEPNFGRILEQNKRDSELYTDRADPYSRKLGIQKQKDKIVLSFTEFDGGERMLKARFVYINEGNYDPHITSMTLKKQTNHSLPEVR